MAICATATTAALIAIANANANANRNSSSFKIKPTKLQLQTLKSTPDPSIHYRRDDDSTSTSSSTTTTTTTTRRKLVEMGMGIIAVMAASSMAFMGFPSEADATRIEYYATTAEPPCELNEVKSGLAYCDLLVGSGVAAPYNTLINVHYTARFGDEIVFDSTYKRGRPLTMRIGVGKVIKGLDQGIFGGDGVPPMQVGGKRKLRIPPELAYGPEPAGCFSGDCNIPANATLLYDIKFVGIYSGNRPLIGK